MEEVKRLSTQKNVTVFTGKIKICPICPTFIRGDPYETQKPKEKLLFFRPLVGVVLGIGKW